MDSSWIIDLLNEINELLTNISGLTGEYTSIGDMINDILTNGTELAGSTAAMFATIIALIELLIHVVSSTFGYIVLVFLAIIAFLKFLATYLITAVPLSSIAKKAGCKKRYIAWIPFFQDLFCLYLLSRIPGKDDFQMGKLHMEERNTSFLVYLLVHFFGSALLTVLIVIINIIPYLGQIIGAFSTVLYLIPTAVLTIIEFVYLRDVLDLFKPKKKNNRLMAWIVSILDSLVTSGWAKRLYLFTLLGKSPLPIVSTVIQPELLPETVDCPE